VPDPRAVGIHGRTLRAAALKGLESEMRAPPRALLAADDGAITLSEHGKLWWNGAIVELARVLLSLMRMSWCWRTNM